MSDLVELHLVHLAAAGYSPRTVADRRGALRRAAEALPFGLDGAHTDEVAAWLATPSWSRWTRSTYWVHLRGYYAWATRHGHLTGDPMAALDRPPVGDSVPDPVTDAEVRIALERSPEQPWRMAVALAAYAGLRAGELCAVAREDVADDLTRVRAGKGGRDGVVPTHPVVWELARDRPAGPLVRSRLGRPVRSEYLVSSQAAHWRSVGLPGVHLHRFRHWYATALLRSGADLRVVQELMRHRNITSTAGYTAVVDARRAAAVSALPTLLL